MLGERALKWSVWAIYVVATSFAYIDMTVGWVAVDFWAERYQTLIGVGGGVGQYPLTQSPTDVAATATFNEHQAEK